MSSGPGITGRKQPMNPMISRQSVTSHAPAAPTSFQPPHPLIASHIEGLVRPWGAEMQSGTPTPKISAWGHAPRLYTGNPNCSWALLVAPATLSFAPINFGIDVCEHLFIGGTNLVFLVSCLLYTSDAA